MTATLHFPLYVVNVCIVCMYAIVIVCDLVSVSDCIQIVTLCQSVSE